MVEWEKIHTFIDTDTGRTQPERDAHRDRKSLEVQRHINN